MMSRLLKLLLISLCILTSTHSFAVVGGAPAAAGQEPWMLALVNSERQTQDPNTSCPAGASANFCKQYCGAVLISPNWALTAAHCLTGVGFLSDLTVVTQGAELNNSATTVGATQRFINQDFVANQAALGQASAGGQTPPPGPYNADDVGLVLLSAPQAQQSASLISTTADATLATLTSTFVSQNAAANDILQLFGYGRLSSTGAFPVQLQQVRVDHLTDTVCDTLYGAGYVSSKMLCAGELTPAAIEPNDMGDPTPTDPMGEGACILDSGSPVFYAGQVAGIVSFGNSQDCGDVANYPDVYTRVANYLGWIEGQSASTAYPLGDLALSLSSTNCSSVLACQVTLQLTNQSVQRVFATAAFSASVNAGQVAVADAGGLDCQANAGVVSCAASTAMSPGAVYTVVLDLTGIPSSLAMTTLAANITSDVGDDYRENNNHLDVPLFFASKPFLQLVDPTSLVTQDDGSVTVFATLENDAPTVASRPQVTVMLPASGAYQLTGGTSGCQQTGNQVSCGLADVSAGAQTQVELSFSSLGVGHDVATISVTATNGNLAGADDTSRQLCISFDGSDCVVTLPGGTPSGSGSGTKSGSVGFIGLFGLFALAMMKCRLRKASDNCL